MKIIKVENTAEYSGTIIIPVFEIDKESQVSMTFNNVVVSSKVFYGKKDSVFVSHVNDCTYVFIGLGKEIDYKSIITIFRRTAGKYKELFTSKVALIIPENFSNSQVEASFAGLYLGTYNLGHYKKTEAHPFLAKDFTLDFVSTNAIDEFANRGLKIAKAQLETFHLVDLPPNKANPEYLANWATEAGKKYGFDVTVFDRAKSAEVGLHSFLAVAKSSGS